MFCPACNYKDTRVIDTRVASSGMSIRRRRVCSKCAYRFSTNELIELFDIVVIKRDGTREAYTKEKIMVGLQRALEKRPFSVVQVNQLFQSIEREIQKKKRREIASKEIGEIILKRLKQFDKVAYIRFASVYKNFSDAHTFASTAQELVRKKSRPLIP